MRFFGDGRYLIISGFEPNIETPLGYRNYQFEVWCVPAHKLLLTDEIQVYFKSTFSPFVMEFQNKHREDAIKACFATPKKSSNLVANSTFQK
jgi:hypothetical protein